VRSDGTNIAACGECGELSFYYDSAVICKACQWLVPNVNELLAERYVANGGPFARDAGVCTGCGHDRAVWPISFPIKCPRCAAVSVIDQRAVNPDTGVSAVCANEVCGFAITIPASIWCPDCRLNLRNPTMISALVRDANKGYAFAHHNGERGNLEAIARQLVVLVDAQEQRYNQLTNEQRKLVIAGDHLDQLVELAKPSEDWIRNAVEIRGVGHKLDREGGKPLMENVARRAAALAPAPDIFDVIAMYWDGIGEWMA
jgi:hypothetical protein